MQVSTTQAYSATFQDTLRELFYQRSLICLWLAVVFFSLFSLLDFVYSSENFKLFLLYRMIFVTFLLCCINILRLPVVHRFAPLIMALGMVFGAFIISLMTVRLGGFYSSYYVGILLMLAGGLSGLPLSSKQTVLIGLSMFVVYIATVLIGTGNTSRYHLIYGLNNSFFFLSIIVIEAIQSFDDRRNLEKEYKAKSRLEKLQKKLTSYTGDLEENIQQRLAALEESNLRYQDLYDNIQDLIVIVDSAGIIERVNRHGRKLLGRHPKSLHKTPVQKIIKSTENQDDWFDDLRYHLEKSKFVRGLQLLLTPDEYAPREVEVSASRVEIDDKSYMQLVLRDISAQKAMERNLLESQRLIGTSRQATIFGLAKLAECRDCDTGAHLNRIRSYSRILAEELGKKKPFSTVITRTFVDDLYYSSVLHDIGKVGIPDSILLKPGRLTIDEFELMKQHTVFGSDVLHAAEKELDSLSFLYTGQRIARSHHERWDSKGYPDGLSGDEIPLAARIISLADVYDALTSTRVYKPSYSHEDSMEIIVEERNKQFDPRIVDAFLLRAPLFKETRLQFLLES